MKASPLVLVRCYLPGYRFGGKLRSVCNIIAALGDQLDFRVGCLDRDLGDEAPYPGMQYWPWTKVGAARVRYLRPGRRVASAILSILRERPHDTVYLSGCFDPVFSVLPVLAHYLGLCGQRTIVVAACGEFDPGAIAIKAFKKRAFLALAWLTGLYSKVVWHATTTAEADNIQAATGMPRKNIRVAPILPTIFDVDDKIIQRGAAKPLRVAFLSRISRKKNLSYALNVLRQVQHPVAFTIYGPIEDLDYWKECEALRAALPAHVQVIHGGDVPYENVPKELATQDVFLLPTLSENFGFAIFEALEMGLPVVISEETPWRGLQTIGIGYDLPLADEAAFANAIDHLASMPPTAFAAMRKQARAFTLDWLRNGNPTAAILKVLTEPGVQN